MRVLAAVAMMVAATGAQAEICIGGDSRRYVNSPGCVVLLELARVVRDAGGAETGRGLRLNQSVQLSATEDGRPLARISYTISLQPGRGPALDARPEVVAALREVLVRDYRRSVCHRFGGFMQLGGVVDIGVDLWSDSIETPEGRIPSRHRNVIDTLVVESCDALPAARPSPRALVFPATRTLRLVETIPSTDDRVAGAFGTGVSPHLSSLPLSSGREADPQPAQPASR